MPLDTLTQLENPPIVESMEFGQDYSLAEWHGFPDHGDVIGNSPNFQQNNFLFTQLVVADRPLTIWDFAIGARMKFQYGGTLSLYHFQPLTIAQPYHLWILLRPPENLVSGTPSRFAHRLAGNQSQGVFMLSGADVRVRWAAGSTTFWHQFATVGDAKLGQWQLIEIQVDGTSSEMWQDGVQLSMNSTSPGTNSWPKPMIGGRWTGTGVGTKGQIAAAFCYSGIQSLDERRAMTYWFTKKWNLTWMPFL